MRKYIHERLYKFFFTAINLSERLVFYTANAMYPLLRKMADYYSNKDGKQVVDKYSKSKNRLGKKVNDTRYLALMISSGPVGFYDSIVEKYLEIEDYELYLDKMCVDKRFKLLALHPYPRILGLQNHLLDVQTIENSWRDGGEQYDYGIDLYKSFCGPLMLYSCLNFDETNDIEEAEIKQLELIAKKLNLKPGMTVLDIGCGFGTLSQYLASNYGVSVTGVTISKDMANYGSDRCKGLNVKIICQDYREIKGKFDRIACIEMSEHVGTRNYRKFISKVCDLLNDDGLFLLQVVSNNQWFMYEYNPIFEKHLGLRITSPHIKRVINDTNGYFIVEHIENIGYNYGLTWSVWLKNFKKNWPKISHLYDERFYRNWSFYFACGSSLFRNRIMHNHQIVFSKNGVKGHYRVSDK